MATPATPLPPVVFEDGLGQRRRVVGARNQTLSVLFLDSELTADPAFESAVRERLAQLAGFHHDAFARARGIVHVTKTPLRLALASDFVDGPRLSEMLAVADERLIPIEIDAALAIIRQIAAAVAALHEHGSSHGALAPERIVITGDARVVVTEYVLGAALEGLRLAPHRCWHDFRIALPPGPDLCFDQRADVAQLGAIALALIVGRPLRADEYPDRVPEMVEGVRAISSTGLEQLPTGVRTWLRRALQLEPRASYASAGEAFAALDGIREFNERTARQALRAFVTTCQEALGREARHDADDGRGIAPSAHSREASAATSPAVAMAPTAAPEITQAREPVPARTTGEDRTTELRIVPRPETTDRSVTPMHEAAPAGGVSTPGPDAPAAESESGLPECRAGFGATLRRHRVAIGVAAVVVVVGATALALAGGLGGETVGTLVVNTNPGGVTVVVDGQHRGSTPLSLELPPGDHVLQLVSDGFVRRIPLTIAEGREVVQFVELPATVSAANGQLHVRSEPAGARVLIDGGYRGVTPLTIDGIAPGTHEVKVEDATASVTQQVAIEAGVAASVVVPLTAARNVPVSGWISVSAPVDVQIYEEGRLLGSSRSEQIMVAAGGHELEIVNEALGYRVRRAVQVTAGNTSAIKLDWPRGSLALNALPWAEVWLDGERLGETPIGNMQVPIGVHRVVFRHPELGEEAHDVTVTLNAPARISADMRKR